MIEDSNDVAFDTILINNTNIKAIVCLYVGLVFLHLQTPPWPTTIFGVMPL